VKVSCLSENPELSRTQLSGQALAEGFAELVTHFCQAVRPFERVLLLGTPSVLPAVEALALSLRHADARAVLQLPDVDSTALAGLLERTGAEDAASSGSELELWSGIDGYVGVRTMGDRASASDKRELSDAEQADAAQVRLLRMTKRKTTTYWPDELLAARAGLSLAELQAYYAQLLNLHLPDPIAGFHQLRDFQAELIKVLERAREVRIQGDGTDVTLRVTGRTWSNSYGRRNTPSGEMFTSPLEDSASGVIHFDIPSYNFAEVVQGVSLELRDGLVVRAHAEQGDAVLQQQLGRDAGARRIGELGIGGNQLMSRVLGSTMFDEKIAGTMHLALGQSYPQTGGKNLSALHWDLIKDLRGEGLISVDGEPFQVDGRFV
jgi:aminopeptidase